MSSFGKHANYEILNLIGYGLAKFDYTFVNNFGFKTKTELYNFFVDQNIAETIGTIKNRQDLFDPFFDNKRKGWWQKGDTYIHRKILIDSLFGMLNVYEYSNILKLYLKEKGVSTKSFDKIKISPIIKSKFKQLQITGQEAELYFINNFSKIDQFENGVLEDARLFGDGYDFQINISDKFYLIEIKGLRSDYGSIRMTKNEFLKAKKYKNNYILVIVYNLDTIPNLSLTTNPIEQLSFNKTVITSTQINYQTHALTWSN